KRSVTKESRRNLSLFCGSGGLAGKHKRRHPGTDFGRDFETDSKKGIVPDALGNKIICPFSDFMLHNIGTGDDIVQTQHAQRPARGASQFLREIEQSPEIQQLRQQLTPQQQEQSQPPRAAVADRCDWKQHLLDVQKFDETGARVLDQRTANEIRTAPLWGLRVIVSRATDSRSRRRKRERALA